MTDPGSGPAAPENAAVAGGPGAVTVPGEKVLHPRGRSVRFAWAAVVLLLVGVIALVIYALTGTPATPRTVERSVTSPDVVSALAKVPPSVFDSVGVTSPVAQLFPPTLLTGQPPLASAAKP